MAKDYYVILGISSDASDEVIRAAFRRRARELHPDTSGLESGPFLEVQEAYGVLSDHERRRRYDEQTRMSPARHRPRWPSPEPLVRERPKAEPFRPIEVASTFQGVSLKESFETHRPTFGELFNRWWGNFQSVSRPKSERLENLTAEVVVSPDEARFGGMVRVEIPAQATCPTCRGCGAVEPYECWRCAGHGALTTEYPVDVEYPPGLRDGYAVRIPLTRFGIANLYLTMLFRVGSDR